MKQEHLIKDRVNGCPTGQRCDNCNLYKPLYRKDDKGNLIEEWDCQINNLSVLIGELKDMTIGVQKSVESRMNSLIRLAENPELRRFSGGN